MEENLIQALKNLERDGVEIECREAKGGDCEFTFLTKTYKTVIGCNDLGFWLVSQIKRR